MKKTSAAVCNRRIQSTCEDISACDVHLLTCSALYVARD